MLIARSALPPDARAKLVADVRAQRTAHPAAFRAVRNVRGHRPEVYRNFRNPIPTTSRELRGLGAPALMPMLEALALAAPQRSSLTEAEWDALAIGMLEAVACLRDARARPVLLAVFAARSLSADVARAAGRALGRLGGDEALALLARHAKPGDPRQLPAIQGLGELRRVESATLLAKLLETTPDVPTVQAIAAALGTLSSSWAWRSLGATAEQTGLRVRAIAARTLAAAYVRHQGPTRTRIAEGLLLADHPQTVDMLRALRSPATTVAVDTLIARLQRQRARRERPRVPRY